jgi:DNA adenine methylase
MTAPTRPILRWHGGKWRLAPWIISHMPKHKVYVEPFGGAASVLLQKPPAITEVWNDLDGALVNLFRVLRDHPTALQRALDLTPYAMAEYHTLYEVSDDPVEAARRFVARSFMGQSSKGATRKSGFDTRINPDGYMGRLNALRAVSEEIPAFVARLGTVVVEHAPALKLIEWYAGPDALIYLDPPYMPDTRAQKSRIYTVDMTREDHEKLLATVREADGMVMLSGYPHRLYDTALADWHRVTSVAYADTGAQKEEVLWLNPACRDALFAERGDNRQLSLFAGAAA